MGNEPLVSDKFLVQATNSGTSQNEQARMTTNVVGDSINLRWYDATGTRDVQILIYKPQMSVSRTSVDSPRLLARALGNVGNVLRLALALLPLLAVLGCQSKPVSLVGTWKATWGDDNYGSSTFEFRSDGTYVSQLDGGTKLTSWSMRQVDEGTYKLNGDTLTLNRTRAVLDTFNPDGSVKTHKAFDAKTDKIKLLTFSDKEFTWSDGSNLITCKKQ